MSTSDIKHIGDLKPDTRNARRHNPRNIGMIADALQEVGAARSIVIDEDGNVLAGNGTVEAAAQAGIERVRVVEADGNEIIAVQRKGLTKREKKRLALYDNRTAELAEWEPDVLADERDLLAGMFSDNELAILTGTFEQPDDPRAEWEGMTDMEGVEAHRTIKVAFESPEAVQEFAALVQQKIADNTRSIWYPPRA